MRLFRFVGQLSLVIIATLVGNFVGSQIRSRLTGIPDQWLIYLYTDEHGATYKNIPVATKFYPALLMVMIGKPRWIYTFLGGVITGGCIGNDYERLLIEWIIGRIHEIEDLYKRW